GGCTLAGSSGVAAARCDAAPAAPAATSTLAAAIAPSSAAARTSFVPLERWCLIRPCMLPLLQTGVCRPFFLQIGSIGSLGGGSGPRSVVRCRVVHSYP